MSSRSFAMVAEVDFPRGKGVGRIAEVVDDNSAQ